MNYVQVTWSLFLVAWPVSQYVQSTARTIGLIFICGDLAGTAVCAWDAVRAPGDWVNYFVAAGQFFLFLVVIAVWLISRRVRTGGHQAGAAAK